MSAHSSSHTSARSWEARAELEALGTRADETLRARRAVASARTAIATAAPWTLVAPVVALVLTAFGTALPIGIVVAGALLPMAALALIESARVLAVAIDARRGLARIDAELEAHDALRSAHDFLGRTARGAFEEAAIVDGLAVLPRAREHTITLDPVQPFPRRALVLPLVALCLCALLVWSARVETNVDLAHALDVASASTNIARALDRTTPETHAAEKATDLAREVHAQKNADSAPSSKSDERNSREDQQRAPRETTGQNGEGRSAAASPASNPSESQGVPSSQSQPSTNTDTAKTKAKQPKQRPPTPPSATTKKKPAQESGATAGRGSGSGSSKNPGATDWASKDQVSTDEEPPAAEDADVDDENEESEARGGLQPNLRDRRPAVNRDLTIGFGNQPNPDANGRGGPSEQKKSRGVASLVLGVPIPDHVKGQPNPGRTKITQERVEPRAQDALAIQASSRTARSELIGTVPRRELTPWMRTLVRDYFLTIRSSKKKTP